MNLIYRFKRYFWILVFGLASLPILSNCVDAEKLAIKGDSRGGGSPVPEGATCYFAGPSIDQPVTADSIRKKLELLELQYINGKINNKTYKTQKNTYLEILEKMGQNNLIEKSTKERLNVRFKLLEKQYENKEINLDTYRRKNNLLLTEKAYYMKYKTVVFKHPGLKKLRDKIDADPKNAEKYEAQLLDALNKLLY